MKYHAKLGASEGSYTPFTVGKQEIVLTSVSLQQVSPGDLIELEIDVTWVKSIYWDMGEMEFILRKDTPDGPVIYWTLETCFEKGRTRESCSFYADPGMSVFYLSVRSADERGVISGDYWLKGTVKSVT
ncbi:hypothetical protein ABID47_005427 [Paenibacillus favisporus]|uniref:Uncharacterized protein n=1 Tax=Paenibacillus favisporus TaxID=221028 RepID=A0ABV2FAP9_9BACL